MRTRPARRANDATTAIPAETIPLRDDTLQVLICKLVTATAKVVPLYTSDSSRAVNLVEFKVYIAKLLLLTTSKLLILYWQFCRNSLRGEQLRDSWPHVWGVPS